MRTTQNVEGFSEFEVSRQRIMNRYAIEVFEHGLLSSNSFFASLFMDKQVGTIACRCRMHPVQFAGDPNTRFIEVDNSGLFQMLIPKSCNQMKQ